GKGFGIELADAIDAELPKVGGGALARGTRREGELVSSERNERITCLHAIAAFDMDLCDMTRDEWAQLGRTVRGERTIDLQRDRDSLFDGVMERDFDGCVDFGVLGERVAFGAGGEGCAERGNEEKEKQITSHGSRAVVGGALGVEVG